MMVCLDFFLIFSERGNWSEASGVMLWSVSCCKKIGGGGLPLPPTPGRATGGEGGSSRLALSVRPFVAERIQGGPKNNNEVRLWL